MDLVALTSIAALISIASGVLAFLVWVRQQVDAARQENREELRTARGEIYEQLRRELSAELRAELYKELLDASSDEKPRDHSQVVEKQDSTEDSADSNVTRLSDTQ
ncbi:MAG: hypothetical protein OXG23_03880 [Chloroflexi bacterium]|nr:hypothetical protein [Chloroflexota bacterium]MCY3977219.1 hypothetical protein [Chloroflexota bacterium]MDE2638057.1 hypothetical protein [Chloroflexota bacterium]